MGDDFARALCIAWGSVFLGPLSEWILYSDPSEARYVNNTFRDIMVEILLSEPGDYESLGWWWTEDANRKLQRNV